MANEKDSQPSQAEKSLQNQLTNVMSGVERTLEVTCESIMEKMRQLEDKIQDMEKRYTSLARDAENALNEVSEKQEPNMDGDKA